MSRETFDNWIIEEKGSTVLQKLPQISAIEAEARSEPMGTNTKDVLRSGDFAIANVAKGGAYSETAGSNDYVQLIARKTGGILRVAEEDLIWAAGDILTAKKIGALSNMARYFDNACIGVTAAENGTTIPHTSIYKALRTTDSSTSYTADANYNSSQLGATATYAALNTFVGEWEQGDFFDESSAVIVASPAFRSILRGATDTQGRPIWVQGLAGTPDTLWGFRVRWSMGARTSAVATPTPTGNPLMVLMNRDYMIRGDARLSPEIASPNPGFALQRAANGTGFATDEALMKAAMMRAFKVAYPQAAVIIEKLP